MCDYVLHSRPLYVADSRGIAIVATGTELTVIPGIRLVTDTGQTGRVEGKIATPTAVR